MPERSPTSLKRRWLRPVLLALALVFAAATIRYSTFWMFASRWQPQVELAFDNTPSLLVTNVFPGSPAEKSGLLPGDQIVAIDGVPMQSASSPSLYKTYKPHKPGDAVHLTIERPGQTAPLVLTGIFRARLPRPKEGRWAEYFAEQVRNSYPVPFVVVGLTVLFLRLKDPKVWHLALLFASFTAMPGFPDEYAAVPPALRPFATVYQAIFLGLVTPLFYWFFAVFPTRSLIDRRLPWLKWASLVIGISFALPGLREGGMRLPPPFRKMLGESVGQKIIVCYAIGFLTLGLVSLATNFFRTTDPEARRKIRVIFWGTGAGLAPSLVVITASTFIDFREPLWLVTARVAISFLIPLSFAYAVVKHRVLEIPVLLKRSARYLLVQRGFTILLSLLSIGLTLLFALSFTRYLRPLVEIAQPAGIALGALFGTVLLWGGSQVHKRVSGKIDRAFFRSAYDARVILEDLAQRTRASTDRGQLAQLLERHLREALQPSSVVVYFQEGDDRLTAAAGAVPKELRAIPATSPILKQLAQRGQPWELPPGSEDGVESSVLSPLHPECLVPVLGRDGCLAGLLLLGPRLSEEPYSGEDRCLLASIAGQVGTVLENIRLAGEIAERMEAERRVTREMEIAKEVQARLLPQEVPHLKSLDCAAQCIEARSVVINFKPVQRKLPDNCREQGI